MSRKLRHLATALQVAVELHHEGKLDNKDYLRLVHSIEVSYKNPDSFTADLTKWCIDFLQFDNVDNHLANFDILVDSFLSSADADDHNTRTEVLVLITQLKKLLLGVQEYDQKKLIERYLNVN